MAETRIYKVGGKAYQCGVLKLGQDQRLAGILGRIGISNVMGFLFDLAQATGPDGKPDMSKIDTSKAIDIEYCLRELAEQELLSEFVATVLQPVEGFWDKGKVPELALAAERELDRDEYVGIIRDFFFKNRDSLRRLFGSSANQNGTVARPRVQPKQKPGQAD